MNKPPEHLLRPPLSVVWKEYARRLNRGEQPASLTLRNLNLQQQHAIADLLGRDKLPGDTLRLPVNRLLAACKLDNHDQLKTIAEAVAGPIVDQKLARAQQLQLKTQLWQWLDHELKQLPNVSSDNASQWLDEQRSKGVSHQRLNEYRHRYQQMLDVMQRLPANGVSLAVLAADLIGDPHALDNDTALGRLCVDAYCALNQLPRDKTSRNSRRQWGWAGVTQDGVSSTVLALGLRQSHDPNTSAWLHHAAEHHEPVQLTYRQIMRWPISALAKTQKAVIVENPSLIEAAANACINTVPIICSAGQPTVAVQRLVQQLGANGAEIFQHADFDPAGMHITRWFQTHANTTPWKMTKQDYLQAIALVSNSLPLDTRSIPDTPWDTGLGLSMRHHGIYVSEEQVRSEILSGIKLIAADNQG